MTFSLSDDQLVKFNEWYNKLEKQYTGAIGGGLTFSFTPTSIGMVVKVKYLDKEEIDLSDYENW